MKTTSRQRREARSPTPGGSPSWIDDDSAGSSLGSQGVDRVADVLEAFLRLGPDLGVSELARGVGLPKATTHRLLASLRSRDFVTHDPVTRRYRLGTRIGELGAAASASMGWLVEAKPELEALAHYAGETVHLAVLEDDQVLYVDKVESDRSLRMPSQVGRRLPAHCTGVGKALLAFLPEERLVAIIDRRGLERYTANTITDPIRLHAELETIRRRGYATDDEEIEEGLRCIAAPVRGAEGSVIAAISISGPASRLPDAAVEARAGRVIAAAAGITIRLLHSANRSGEAPGPQGVDPIARSATS